MSNYENTINFVVEFFANIIGGALIYYFGMVFEQKEISYGLFTLYAIDIITGIFASIKNGVSFKSSIFSFGIFFRFFILFLILYVYNFFNQQKLFSEDILKFFLLVIMFSELASIRENIIKWKNIDVLVYFLKGFNLYKKVKNKTKNSVLDEKNGIKNENN